MATASSQDGRRGATKGRFLLPGLPREVLLALGLSLVLSLTIVLYLPLLRTLSLELTVIFLSLAVLADLVRVNVRHGNLQETIVLLEPLLVASVILMPGWFSLAMVSFGVLGSALFTRPSLFTLLFNLGTTVASTASFVLCYRLIVGPETIQTTASISQINLVALTGLVVGGFAYATLNAYLSFRVVSAVTGEPVVPNLRRALPLAWVSILVSVAVGAALVVVYASAPGLLPLVALAGGALLYSHLRTTRREKEIDRSSQLAALSDIIAGGASSEMLESFLHLVRGTFDVDMAMMVLKGNSLMVVENIDGDFLERQPTLEDKVLLDLDVPRQGRLLAQADIPSPWIHGLIVPLGDAARRSGIVMLGSRSKRSSLTQEGAVLLTSLVGALVAAQRNAALSDQIQAITASQAEAVLSTDASGQITFANPAAVELLVRRGQGLLGVHHEEIFGLFQGEEAVDFLDGVSAGAPLSGEATLTRASGKPLSVHYTASRIRHASSGAPRPGVVLALVDMTEQINAQEKLLRSQELLAETGRTLQKSLLPPVLPDLPGAQVATHYHAGAAGLEVGGDFYDVFDILEESWMVVIGDVCGRGAEAAALTALTRHTLRAAALRETAPARVLETLNEAILRHHGDDRFCTVAAARLRLGDAPSVRVSCAGHPSPLLVRSDGSIRTVGPSGTLLGVLPTIDVSEEEVPLRKGDILLFYTDGVSEARNKGGVQFGEGDLAHLLQQCALLPASEVADRLVAALDAFRDGPPEDDTAFVVISL